MPQSSEREKKWVKKWQESGIFEAEPDKKKKKFFGTFPYPYVNSYLHLGHFYTSMRLEAFSRYKRMQGFNVLYAQGWHCTGSPIVSTAKRVKEKEPKQIDILKKQGFSDQEIEKFSDPIEWIRYFPEEAKKDFINMGYSIDWRRSFITTELNPHYDKFIKWQFNKLKEKGLIKKGKFPVVWDPVENAPVGDHDRIEGEGEIPQEFVLCKHKLDDKYIVTATLRPDTIMGVTNLYVNPDSELVEAKVDDERWIISEKVARELGYQDKKVELMGKVRAAELVGRNVKEFSGDTVPVLPAFFVDINVGTGIVHSVPSDSADDLIALYDLQKNKELCQKYGLDFDMVKSIKPIPVLEIPDYGKIPADDIIKKLGISSQQDKDKLEKAKELLYNDGFYKGRFNRLYAKGFKKDYSGKAVQEAKEHIKKEFINSEFGDVFYQLTGKVVARSLAECVVKIVDDQWFIAYGDKKWKQLAHKCLDRMRLYPEKTRSQFKYVLDWLRDWACTREFGLGTRLPWDDKWLIESLSDSTIYMAYYTIAHTIKGIPAEEINDSFFDYVFLGRKEGKLKVPKEKAEQMKAEFEYWYPMDFRNTGKDLIQNHMSFCIFNHTAIFSEKHYPLSFGLNGHVTVNGEKMAKSKGNFILMREALQNYGADASRFAILSGGEGIDDANFDTEMAKSMVQKIEGMLEFAKENYGKGRENILAIDRWMEMQIDRAIRETTTCYEETLFRSALQASYFEMQNSMKWYMKRTMGNPNRQVMQRFIEIQALLLAPITPFISEEIWEAIGKNRLIAAEKWPSPQKQEGIDNAEELIRETMEDIKSVVSLVKLKPNKITLFVAEEWKYRLNSLIKDRKQESRDFKFLMAEAMKDSEMRKHAGVVSSLIQKILKNPGKEIISRKAEIEALEEAIPFFEKEFQACVEVIPAENSSEKKAANSIPNKPAILIK